MSAAKSGKKRRAALLALVFALAACGRNDPDRIVASGTVEATDAQLGFDAPGRIAEIVPREGDAVKAGERLASLDRAEAEARERQVAAQLEAARAQLRDLERGFRGEEIAQAKAEAEAAATRLADAERELARSEKLFAGGAISAEARDKAEAARDVARAQWEKARKQQQLVERGYRTEQVDAARAQVAQAEAGLAAAQSALRDQVIVAPFDGVVTVRHREPGEIASAGTPVLTLMNPGDRWVRIYVAGDRIGLVKLGQKAEIASDTFRDRRYPGEVTFIASEAEFTPKNVQTPEERVKLVYAVKVRLSGDDGGDLKPGMPADVTLAASGGGEGAPRAQAEPE